MKRFIKKSDRKRIHQDMRFLFSFFWSHKTRPHLYKEKFKTPQNRIFHVIDKHRLVGATMETRQSYDEMAAKPLETKRSVASDLSTKEM